MSLNYCKRFLAALNLVKGPGLLGKVSLMSIGDMEVHVSREICVIHVTVVEVQLLAESFRN